MCFLLVLFWCFVGVSCVWFFAVLQKTAQSYILFFNLPNLFMQKQNLQRQMPHIV